MYVYKLIAADTVESKVSPNALFLLTTDQFIALGQVVQIQERKRRLVMQAFSGSEREELDQKRTTWWQDVQELLGPSS